MAPEDTEFPVDQLDSKKTSLLSPGSSRKESIGQLTVPVDSEVYKMDSWPRGICLIFNIENFHKRQNLNSRPGSTKDGQDFKDCLKELGFITIEHKDEKCSYAYIIEALNTVARQDHSTYDCLIIAIMSHGDKGELRAYDRPFMVDELFEPFQNCPTLFGKPKLFFIQACRGKLLDSGRLVRDNSQDVPDSLSDSLVRIPTWADFLVAYSTVEGYYSWRNTTMGSWFIQSLVSQLKSDFEHSDLLSILISVNRKVAYEFMSRNPKNETCHEKKQVPSITCMLTRKVFFKQQPLR